MTEVPAIRGPVAGEIVGETKFPTRGQYVDPVKVEKGLAEARRQGMKEGAASAARRADADALAALQAAHNEEIGRLRGALTAQWEEKSLHMKRAARLWGALAGVAVGGTISGCFVYVVLAGSMNKGTDIGIDAAMKSRMIEDTIRKSNEPERAPDQGLDRSPTSGHKLFPPASAP